MVQLSTSIPSKVLQIVKEAERSGFKRNRYIAAALFWFSALSTEDKMTNIMELEDLFNEAGTR